MSITSNSRTDFLNKYNHFCIVNTQQMKAIFIKLKTNKC